ncbi:MAG: D-glycero-alpha-D-manno-heptose-1,7-bisphosphate 7-phosphatase [Bacteroidia bacterium]|nr:D-glycero-alpha-D-manno-heptose-1,7-bisphosphate 7-phosphatase [Bacteroidia bacterium]
MNKAAFLDRDGVINVDVLDYTSKIKDFKFLPGVFEGLKQLQEKGYLLIVITNQGGIAKGLYTKEDVDTLHTWMCAELAKQGITITEIYFCPHHDVSGKCLCRKPGSLMLEKAMARFDIDATQSFFMGDKDTDAQAAERAGVMSVKVVVNSEFKVPV